MCPLLLGDHAPLMRRVRVRMRALVDWIDGLWEWRRRRGRGRAQRRSGGRGALPPFPDTLIEMGWAANSDGAVRLQGITFIADSHLKSRPSYLVQVMVHCLKVQCYDSWSSR